MPINHQINLTSQITEIPDTLAALMPVGIIGTAASGADNTILEITSDADLTQFGTDAANSALTLLKDLKILRRYGLSKIFAIKVPTGGTPAATETNIIGAITAGVKTGLDLFRDVETTKYTFPRWILIPGFSSETVVAKAITVATATKSKLALDFAAGTSAASAIATRATAVGLGTKNRVLHPCIPHVKIGAVVENLSAHLVGVQATQARDVGYGFTPSNKLLPGVNGIESGFTLSYTDPNADNQLLERAGCVSVNNNSSGYTLWGNRNGLFESTVEEDWDTYISLNRVEQELNYQFLQTSMRFIDETANVTTAMLLESAFNNIIRDNLSFGNYSATSVAKYNQTKSDLTVRRLNYDVVIRCNLPTEVIEIASVYTVNL